ncbi:MAG TPA: ATP-binding protein [Syntrophobacteraceae bacterium]|nr:ATP-binding protein [Syntrophobacteraceae bacterium]
MLTRFRLENFRSYHGATLDLSPLTLMVGANASGKSNALEALQMLSWLSRGRRLEDVFRAVEQMELLIRGRVTDLTYEGAQTFRLGCSLQQAGPWRDLDVEIAVDKEGMRIRQESITSPTERSPLYKVEQPATGFSHDILVSYNNFARGGIKPQISCTDQQGVFTQLLTPARFANHHTRSQKEIPSTAKVFIQALERILFLDPVPRRMREPSYVFDKALKGDGSNISSTLHDLCVGQQAKEKVLDFIRDLPEQDIADLQFLEGPRQDVMVQLEETFGGTGKLREAALLSDGTLRVLAVAAALLSAPAGSMVVVEEIDNGVHPSRASRLLANIESVAREKNLAVLVTTHNPALLDALPDGAVPNVVFCYRDPQKGDSRLVRLSEIPDFPDLVAQGPLGRLLTQGIIDRFVKTARSPEEKVRAGLEWIHNLRKTAAS